MDALEDFKQGYDFTNNGKCSGCGACCSRFLPVSQKEINQIHRYIEKHGIKQQEHGTAVLKPPFFDGNCPFLDETKKEKKCAIYDVRPLICRDYLCTKDKVPDRELYSDKRKICDFTEEFFGKK